MGYMVNQLAKLAGISGRTLRYYDSIGLLKPAAINDSGYRTYGAKEVDALQQILFYREMGFSLEEIQKAMQDPAFDELSALCNHKKKLESEQKRLKRLIATINATIESKTKGNIMADSEKFEGLKKQLIEENEKKYGREIREKYGEEAVAASNEKFAGQSEADFKKANALAQQIFETLYKAMDEGDPAGETAQKACALHKQWLLNYWAHYTPEAHLNLTQMYLDDPRFLEYYDKERSGTAAFLNSAMKIFTQNNE